MHEGLKVTCTTDIKKLLNNCLPKDCRDLLAILIAASTYGPIGRKLVSRLLGLGEKRVRRLIGKLKAESKVKALRAGIEASIRGFRCIDTSGKTIALLSCSRDEAVKKLSKLLLLRDRIVIELGDPSTLEVIGYAENGKVDLPYVEEHHARRYTALLLPFSNLEECKKGCLLAVFQKSSCIYCCASFLHASLTLG